MKAFIAIIAISLWACTSMFGAAAFRVVDAGLPEGVDSYAVDLNDNGVLLARLNVGGPESTVLVENGAMTRIAGPGNYAWAHALNNQNQIVGYYIAPPVTNESGLYYPKRAWMHSGGTNVLLAEDFTEDSEALGINDLGQVVGFIGFEGYMLHPERKSMYGERAWFGVQPSQRLNAINNNGIVVGEDGGVARRWRAGEPGQGLWLPGGAAATVANSHDVVAGQGNEKLTVLQGIVWNGTNASYLGGPLKSDIRVHSMNDQGALVGKARDRWGIFPPPTHFVLLNPPMLWTNGVGIDLNTITDVPRDHYLLNAVAINENGEIAADMRKYDGSTRAVILRPAGPLELPEARVVSPQSTIIYETFDVNLAISTNAQRKISSVEYQLYWRKPLENQIGGDFWEGPRWLHLPYRTNWGFMLDHSDPWAAFGPPGQYVVSALVTGTNAIRGYLPPVFFTIAGPFNFGIARVNLRGDFEYGFHGRAGFKYVVEESTNLIDWSAVTNTFGTLGGVFDSGSPALERKFVRARVVETDVEFAGIPLPYRYPPAQPDGYRFELLNHQNEFVYDIRFTTDAVELRTTAGAETGVRGSFTYRHEGDRRVSVVMRFPETQTEIQMVLEWSVTEQPNVWRATEIKPTGRVDYSGRIL